MRSVHVVNVVERSGGYYTYGVFNTNKLAEEAKKEAVKVERIVYAHSGEFEVYDKL